MFDIPIFINNFNRLSTTRKLVHDLNLLGYYNTIIIDNGSTYLPLLEWYNNEYLGSVIRCFDNLGSRALWHPNIRNSIAEYSKNTDYIIYTDSDLELNEHFPMNFAKEMQRVMEKYNMNKVGLALEINDLPATEFCNKIRYIETPYWRNKLADEKLEVYRAPIDTTFSMIRANQSFTFSSLRIAGNYTCKHIPWYKSFEDLDEEELFIMGTANEKISTTKQHYLKWKTNCSQ